MVEKVKVLKLGMELVKTGGMCHPQFEFLFYFPYSLIIHQEENNKRVWMGCLKVKFKRIQ